MNTNHKLKVISIQHDVPHREITIKAEMNLGLVSVIDGKDVFLLTKDDIYNADLEYCQIFQKYRDARDELAKYKQLMKDLKILMEAKE